MFLLKTSIFLFSAIIILFYASNRYYVATRRANSLPISSLDNKDCTPTIDENDAQLNMTLCKDKCNSDCKTYLTPVSECYNSGSLFPNDPSWSGLDIWDTVICQTLTRTIFHTSNGSCLASDNDDRFQINLEECVGPFGKPRPWGTFSLVHNKKQNGAESSSFWLERKMD